MRELFFATQVESGAVAHRELTSGPHESYELAVEAGRRRLREGHWDSFRVEKVYGRDERE